MNRTTKTPTLSDHAGYSAAVRRLTEMRGELAEIDRQINDAQRRFEARCKTRDDIARLTIAGKGDEEFDGAKIERTLTQMRTRRARLVDAIALHQRETVQPLHIEASKAVCDAMRPAHRANVKRAAKLLRELAETLDEQRAMFESLAAGDAHCIDLRPMLLPGISLTEQSSLARHYLLEAMEHGFISAADAGVKSLVDPAPPPHKPTFVLPQPKRGKSILELICGAD